MIQLSHLDILNFIQTPSHYIAWDFITALGDTIKEKYEHLLRTVYHAAGMMDNRFKLRKTGYWIAAEPLAMSILETCSSNFWPTPSSSWVPGADPMHIGQLGKRFDLFKDTKLDPEFIVVGHYAQFSAALIVLENYIF